MITEPLEWETVRDIRIAAGSDRNRNALLALQEMLLGLRLGGGALALSGSTISGLSAPFEAIAVSNGSAVSSTPWAALSDIVHASAGTAHSWIHLRRTDYFGEGDHLHLLLDAVHASHQIVHVTWARGVAGFNADGTIQNAPTLAGAVAVVCRSGTSTSGTLDSSAALFPPNPTLQDLVIHLQQTADGQHGRLFVLENGYCSHWFGWTRELDGPADRDWPAWVWVAGRSSAAEILLADSGNLANNSGAVFRSVSNDDTVFAGAPTWPAVVGGTAVPTLAANAFDGSRRVTPIQIASVAGNVGVHSRLPDHYWGRHADTTGLGTRLVAPSGTPFDFRQLGGTLIVWPLDRSMAVS